MISEKVAALSHAADTVRQESAPVPRTGLWKWLAPLGPAALILRKFKFLFVALATKGRLLILGLTKSSTLLTMFLSVGVDWTAWGLWFALGFVLSIYIHEIGHVAALRRYGIAATAPMFIPGVGALVRMRQSPAGATGNARVGLAGPWWGLGAAVASYGIALGGGGGLFLAIARTGAWVNLFNLLPVWQLDGNRGFAALTRTHRWIAVAALVAAWAIAGDGLLVLLILVAIVRALGADAPEKPDAGALWLYSAAAVALAIIFRIAEPDRMTGVGATLALYSKAFYHQLLESGVHVNL
jgi:Zn-dependent protease